MSCVTKLLGRKSEIIAQKGDYNGKVALHDLLRQP